MDNIDEAAAFMAQHCPEWVKETGSFGSEIGCSLESFAAAELITNPLLHERLKVAHTSGDLEAFWRRFHSKIHHYYSPLSDSDQQYKVTQNLSPTRESTPRAGIYPMRYQ